MYFSLSNGTITLEQNTLGNQVDVEASEEPVLSGQLKLAQNNFFKYTNDIDTDLIYDNFAEYNKSYDIDSIESSNLIEIPYSSSNDIYNIEKAGNNFNVIKIPLYNGITNIAEDRLQQSLRFFLISSNSTSIDSSYIGFFQASSTNNLNFNSLYSRFYANYYDYLQGSRLMTLTLKLTFAKWLEIRASGLIYYKGNLLTVLQITKFNPNRLSEIKAIARGSSGVDTAIITSDNWEDNANNWENETLNWEVA